jgi:hypothetical protein
MMLWTKKNKVIVPDAMKQSWLCLTPERMVFKCPDSMGEQEASLALTPHPPSYPVSA